MRLETLSILLEELINSELSKQRFHGQLRDRKGQGKDSLGQGYFSTVRDHKSDPHLVKKHSHRVMGDDKLYTADGFDIFVRQLIKLDKIDNPHFPKVYTAKKIVDRGDNHINSYEMERLVESKSLDDDEWEAVMESHFVGNLGIRTKRGVKGYGVKAKLRIADVLRACIEQPSKVNRYIKLDSLKEAVLTVSQITRQFQADIDMHSGNFMFRRGPHGLMLVITDPLSGVETD